jgi:hypothetical protein
MARAVSKAGIVPILTRLAIQGGGGPISVRRPVTADGRYQLLHTVDAKGEVDRLVMAMWVSMTAPKGRTHSPEIGEPVWIGKVYAEHVFTRLFAPPEQRKVLSFALPELAGAGIPAVPPDRYDWRPGEQLLMLPDGAKPLDRSPEPDDHVTVFGVMHTDSNHHVNSLVYPRLFEEAALRRFATHERSAALLARQVEVAYRKPCFAGDKMRIELQAYVDADGAPCAVGTFIPADGGRPHCWMRMAFAP